MCPRWITLPVGGPVSVIRHEPRRGSLPVVVCVVPLPPVTMAEESRQGKERMLFPESPRVVYQNNPLEEVLCQLRFPAILQISTVDPAGFQNRIRDRYPLYTRQEEVGFPKEIPKEIAEVLAHLPFPKPSEDIIHKFLIDDSSRLISLTRGFLAITDRKYRRWEDFSAEVLLAMSALEEEYHPAFYSRIGLRYVDVISRTKLGLEGEPWGSLINPAVAGVLGENGVSAAVRETKSEVLFELNEDPVTKGFAKLRHGLVNPQDGGDAYLFDVDFFTTERSSSTDVAGILHRFNRLAGYLFRWAITPKLAEALRPMAMD